MPSPEQGDIARGYIFGNHKIQNRGARTNSFMSHSTPAVVPPSPAAGYEDFEPFTPSGGNAPYVPAFAGETPQGTAGRAVTQTPSPDGVWVSVDEVRALQQFAQEAADLRTKLAASEDALAAARAQSERNTAEEQSARPPLRPVAQTQRRPPSETTAIATKRQQEVAQRHQDEVTQLREEWRLLRAQQQKAKCLPVEVEMIER